MSYTIAEKAGKRILLITPSEPFDFRVEPAKIMGELHAILGNITDIVYLIYDIRDINIGFSDIVDGLSGFGQPRSEFEKQLIELSRMILVGSGALVTVGAKTAARLSPERPYPVFMTPEEALDYAQAELAKRQY